MSNVHHIKIKQQINVIENDVLELRKTLEQTGVYTSNSKIYNVINDMISNILQETSAIRKTVKTSTPQTLLKG